MKLAHKKREARLIISEWREHKHRVALVPTMGALHEGHITLIRQARRHADHVVVSIFVNPVQFVPGEDFESYPRQLNKDVECCRKEGVSLVFAPDEKEMYGGQEMYDQEEVCSEQEMYGLQEMYGVEKRNVRHHVSFHIGNMNKHLCGPGRPGHFEGVLLVVNKLLHIIQPDVAIFGQKDIQQWFIIRQMVEEHDHPVEILMGPTRREEDGLALSSRNVYLNAQERQKAPLLFETLQRLSQRITEIIRNNSPGKIEIPLNPELLATEKERLRENGFTIDYLSIVSTPDLQPADVIKTGHLFVLAVAAWLGKTRLIDNVLLNTRKISETDHDA